MKRNRIRFGALALSAALFAALSLSACGGTGQGGASPAGEAAGEGETVSADADGYAGGLFDTDVVHTLDVAVSGDDWADLLKNPLNKTKYEADVTIDGETVRSASFATKGNTSLSFVASDPDSSRYSFKINFGKFVDGQTFHGLDKLNLNNLYADATYAKDYLSYEIFRQAGVDAPLCSYVWLTVNGEDQGLYLAIEEIGASWLERTRNGAGELYKPETEQLDNANQGGGMQPPGGFGGRGGGMPFSGGDLPRTPSSGGDMPQVPFSGGELPFPFDGLPSDGFSPFEEGGSDGGGRFRGPGGGFGGASSGADLAYTDDSPESYADIFNNAETDVDEADQKRVIAALKALSEGGDMESCLDTEEVLRYFAAHNFVLNYDSYTGNMLHNYYLYENGGKLSMLPWDYNLAFGGFSMGRGEDGATALVNTGMDTPLSGASEAARPMWAWIPSDADYLEQYHGILDELLVNYFESGAFEGELDALHDLLLPYVQKDPTAFFTAEEFETGLDTLRQFCLLRARSIRLQLNGDLASSTEEQDPSGQVDASGLSVRDMGSQGGGGDFPGGGERFGGGRFGGRGNSDGVPEPPQT